MTIPANAEHQEIAMNRDELRAALAVLDVKIEAAEDAAKPAREALKPFQNEIDELRERRELLLEENETEYVGKCEFCTRIIFEGDLGCRYDEDGGYLCEACSPTLAEALNNWIKNEADVDADDFRETTVVLRARIAEEGPDVKLVSPL